MLNRPQNYKSKTNEGQPSFHYKLNLKNHWSHKFVCLMKVKKHFCHGSRLRLFTIEPLSFPKLESSTHPASQPFYCACHYAYSSEYTFGRFFGSERGNYHTSKKSYQRKNPPNNPLARLCGRKWRPLPTLTHGTRADRRRICRSFRRNSFWC